MRYVALLLCAFISMTTFATPVLQCINHSFLKKGFNLEQAQKCQTLLNACKQDTSIEATCRKKVLKRNRHCQQLSQLAHVLQTSPDALSFTASRQFILIDQFFLADGQHSYYVLTPKNCLINTKIDPRKLDNHLEKEFKNLPFMIVNYSKPELISHLSAGEQVRALLKITKTCLACELIGFAQISFDFNHEGKLIHVKLENFSRSLENISSH